MKQILLILLFLAGLGGSLIWFVNSPTSYQIQQPKILANFPPTVQQRYQALENHLVANDWRAANQATVKHILSLAHQTNQPYMGKIQNLEQFPCEDLKVMNDLWVHHSQRRFGFSIQRDIYAEFGDPLRPKYDRESFNAFKKRIGWFLEWRWRNPHLGQRDLNFSISAPKGHLPSLKVAKGGSVSIAGGLALFSRLYACRI